MQQNRSTVPQPGGSHPAGVELETVFLTSSQVLPMLLAWEPNVENTALAAKLTILSIFFLLFNLISLTSVLHCEQCSEGQLKSVCSPAVYLQLFLGHIYTHRLSGIVLELTWLE